MPRPASLRLTICVTTAAATLALGLLAPSASADPRRTGLLPQSALHVGNAQSVVPDVPTLGRKLS